MEKSFPLVKWFKKAIIYPPINSNSHYYVSSNQLRNNTIVSLRKITHGDVNVKFWKKAWILESTWRLVNKRVSERQYPANEQALIWRLGRAIAASLKDDR